VEHRRSDRFEATGSREGRRRARVPAAALPERMRDADSSGGWHERLISKTPEASHAQDALKSFLREAGKFPEGLSKRREGWNADAGVNSR